MLRRRPFCICKDYCHFICARLALQIPLSSPSVAEIIVVAEGQINIPIVIFISFFQHALDSDSDSVSKHLMHLKVLIKVRKLLNLRKIAACLVPRRGIQQVRFSTNVASIEWKKE